MDKRPKKITRTLTLSVYEYGQHRVHGHVKQADIDEGKLSFAESMFVIIDMIQELQDWPLGSKIKVTFEVLRKNES